MSSKRMDWVDSYKGLAIFIVVMGHALPVCLFRKYLYSFGLQTFFLIYGFCATGRTDWTGFCKLLKNRAYSVLLPFAIWGLIFDTHSLKNMAKVLYGTNHSLAEAGSSGVLWFLPTFFITLTAFEFVLYKFKKSNVAVLVSALIAFIAAAVMFELDITDLPWGLNIGCLAYAYMGVGYFARKYVEIDNPLGKATKYFHIPMCLIGFASGFLVYKVSENTVKHLTQMANADYGNIYLFFIAGVGVDLAVLYVIKKLYEFKNMHVINEILRKWGVSSFMIMILHREFITHMSDVLKLLHLENNEIIAIIYALITVVCSYFIGQGITKVAPILAGKK